jgi:hypothetical protein
MVSTKPKYTPEQTCHLRDQTKQLHLHLEEAQRRLNTEIDDISWTFKR